MEKLWSHLEDETGATMVEYAFLLLGIALVVAIAATALGPAVGDAFRLPLPFL